MGAIKTSSITPDRFESVRLVCNRSPFVFVFQVLRSATVSIASKARWSPVGLAQLRLEVIRCETSTTTFTAGEDFFEIYVDQLSLIYRSLISFSFSSCCFHFPPLKRCSHFLLFIPHPRTSIKGPVPSPNGIIEFRDSLFGEYTASKHHGRHLNENLELHGKAAIDRVQWLEKQMCE